MATDISLRTVQRVLFRWNIMSEVIQNPRLEGNPKKLSNEQLQFVIGLLRHTPDLYLDEIKEELWQRHGIGVSLSTLHKELKELELTRKLLSKQRLVFIDESALNMLVTYRKYSVLPALTLSNIIWFSSALGSFNGTMFLEFLDGLLTQMNPYPAPTVSS
ncbi:hypothetical protein BKA62DRAFT_780289 [Auriculariales sp. MPI-PUGE-AT-0066]|nr:hypothetical protein BKA62DRAFT_780289 [Auriculariales sp. MPI-PUGE-AT-0066]